MRKFFCFTLIEMLIVIFIISIGAAILFPALNQARKKASAIVCTNNLKQPLTMLQMYSIDYTEIPIKYYSKSLLAAGYINEHNYSFLICPDWEPRKELGELSDKTKTECIAAIAEKPMSVLWTVM